jgi:hypothetical protein
LTIISVLVHQYKAGIRTLYVILKELKICLYQDFPKIYHLRPSPEGIGIQINFNFTNKFKVTANMQASVIGVARFPLEYKKN